MTVLRAAAIVGVLVASGATVVDAQTVQGRVYDASTDRRIPSALIRLVDASGEDRVAFAADSTGRFSITAPGAGSYRLQADHLGYDTFESDAFDLMDPTTTVTVDVSMRATPIPIRGLEVSTDQANRRIRELVGMSPGQLRIRPIRTNTLRDHMSRGNPLSEVIRAQSIPNLRVLPTRDGPCYEFRGRGCMPVYLDGVRLGRAPNSVLPLEMLSTVVLLLPSEHIAYPLGAVHLLTIGFMR